MHLRLVSRRRGVKLVALIAALAGCSSTGGATADAGGEAGLSPSAVQTVDDLTLGLAVATALSAPLAPDGALVQTDPPGTSDATTQGHAAHGFSGSSVVTPQSCAKYSWSKLTATVTLTGCTLEANGMPVSGTVSLGVTARPTAFTVTFTGLTVGTSTFGGHVAITISGTKAMPSPPTLDVDVTYASGGKSEQLTATGLTVTTTATSIAISGDAKLTSGGTSTSLTATGLTWQTGQCLPSSGTVKMSGSTVPTSTITFLATTPMDGKVTVQIPPLPATTQKLFTPCP